MQRVLRGRGGLCVCLHACVSVCSHHMQPIAPATVAGFIQHTPEVMRYATNALCLVRTLFSLLALHALLNMTGGSILAVSHWLICVLLQYKYKDVKQDLCSYLVFP